MSCHQWWSQRRSAGRTGLGGALLSKSMGLFESENTICICNTYIDIVSWSWTAILLIWTLMEYKLKHHQHHHYFCLKTMGWKITYFFGSIIETSWLITCPLIRVLSFSVKRSPPLGFSSWCNFSDVIFSPMYCNSVYKCIQRYIRISNFKKIYILFLYIFLHACIFLLVIVDRARSNECLQLFWISSGRSSGATGSSKCLEL